MLPTPRRRRRGRRQSKLVTLKIQSYVSWMSRARQRMPKWRRPWTSFSPRFKRLRKHVPVSAQGPLIVNALSTAFQFQMSVWWMIGDECVHPLRAKHSDWRSLAGIVQAIVETFPKNCAIMFPPALAPAASFPPPLSWLPLRRRTMTSCSALDSTDLIQVHPCPLVVGAAASAVLLYSRPPLCSKGGHFVLVTDRKEAPSSSLGVPPPGGEEPEMQYLNKDLDAGLEADDEGNGEKDQHGGDDSLIDASELEILQGIISPGANGQVSIMPKSGKKRGSGHLDGSGFSDLSAEDLDTKGARNRKKGLTPTKMASNTSQWTEEDIHVVHQIRYKTDLD